nr:hypothetical protein [Tanacetum cinerariifolium]
YILVCKKHSDAEQRAAYVPFRVPWSGSSIRVIGNDVCKAVKEFFSSGRMLGEINATLISLIPKVETPNKVTDFRLIACCNVLYKCISKEYSRQHLPNSEDNERIQKERGFTINVNGDIIGYFKGGRGLRQGDPVSPYIFTLIMDIFSLMLKRHINNHPRVIKSALDEFSACSGLLPNSSKSTVFFGSLSEEEKSEILNVISFTTGKLPVNMLKEKQKLTGRMFANLNIRGLEKSSQHKRLDKEQCERWPIEWRERFPMITSLDVPAINTDNDNKIVWRTREGRDLDFSDKLSTQDKFKKWGDCVVNRCVLCCNEFEDLNHLLFKCSFAKELWNNVTVIANIHTSSLALNHIVGDLLLLQVFTEFGKKEMKGSLESQRGDVMKC